AGADTPRAERVGRVAVLPQLPGLRYQLRTQRVRGRTVEPDHRHGPARLEQNGLLLEPRVGLRIWEEALARLAAEPPLRDQTPQDRRRGEVLAPLGLGSLERAEHVVEPALV